MHQKSIYNYVCDAYEGHILLTEEYMKFLSKIKSFLILIWEGILEGRKRRAQAYLKNSTYSE